MTERQRFLKYASYLANCSNEGFQYGTCVSNHAEKISKGDCKKEFEALIRCVKTQIKTAKK